MAESCDRIITGLRRGGVVVDIVHFVNRAGTLKRERHCGGRHIVCPTRPDASHALNALWTELMLPEADRNYTHVVAYGGVVPLLGAPVYAAWLGCPLITLLRGNDFDAAVFNPKRREVLREAIERSARVCAVSRDKKQKIERLFPKAAVDLTPNGIDLDAWEPLPSHREKALRWRETLTRDGRKLVGLFGEIKHKKGGAFFLNCLLASGCMDRFHLLFVGEVEEAILAWLSDRRHPIAYSVVDFMGRYDLLAYYLCCDLMAIPSFYDGLPNVLLEGAAARVPMLASSTGGMADFLVDEIHGFLFRPGDKDSCREAIQRAVNASGPSLERMGQACRALVESQLTERRERDRYLVMLRETSALGRTSRRDAGGAAGAVLRIGSSGVKP